MKQRNVVTKQPQTHFHVSAKNYYKLLALHYANKRVVTTKLYKKCHHTRTKAPIATIASEIIFIHSVTLSVKSHKKLRHPQNHHHVVHVLTIVCVINCDLCIFYSNSNLN